MSHIDITAMKKILPSLYLLLLLPAFASAMNVKSIEITWQHVSQLTYRGNAIYYLYDPSPIDSAITLYWGDNTSSILVPTLIEDVPGELKRVTFSGIHTYSGPSTFTMYVSYKVRSINVLNVPMSLVTDIYAEATLVVSPFLTGLQSPVFLQSPQLNACRGIQNDMDLSAWDSNGDDLVYQIIPCRGENGATIAGYTYPTATASFNIDANSGSLIWNMPSTRGFFNYAVKVSKYRNGVFLGSIMRDALVNVIDCTPDSPTLTAINDTCVLAGNSLSSLIYATYNGNDSIVLTASGEPLLLANQPAIFNQPVRGLDSVSSMFSWNVACSHVRPDPYHVLFKASLEDSLSSCDCGYDFENTWSPFIAHPGAEIGNPCGPGWDGSNYFWFGSDSSAPRSLTTPLLDLTAGNYMIVFDMRYADHTGNPGTDCEGPDEPDEGIYLQYSTNGLSGPWITMAYWDPSLSPGEGGHVSNLIGWSNYTVVVPEAAISSNTRIRWMQFEATGMYYDHWGIDNVNVFKISDKLPDVEQVSISVIAPAPENLTAIAAGTSILLEWDSEICTEAAGYNIYRLADSSGYVPSGCETGVPSSTGYQLIAVLNSINDTTYIDDNNGSGLPRGNRYCYMVTAWFENGSESQASNEACEQLPEDLPVITHVDVVTTAAGSGSIFVDWSKPDDFDTTAFSGPFRYDIYRASGFTGGTFNLVASNSGLNDTTFTDTGINTVDGPWHYRIDLLYAASTSNYTYYGSSFPASSVFLSITPYDQQLWLNWQYAVPWTNDSTIVYRYNPLTMVFDSIGITQSQNFIDSGLVNGQNYCYKVETIGSYSLSGYVEPIRNFSQEVCAMPMDVVPPCPVELDVLVNCDDVSNELIWSSPLSECGDGDVGGYEIYYSAQQDGELVLLATHTSANDTTFIHSGVTSVAGCYAVAAYDTVGNISALSNIVCVDIDSCDLYQLPNVFTPNGDGINDFFRPFPYDFVEKIDLTIFDRWGLAMFTTDNPDIMWNGVNASSGQPCSEGVYFYVCEVFEMRLSGIRQRTLTGTVHLYRNQ